MVSELGSSQPMNETCSSQLLHQIEHQESGKIHHDETPSRATQDEDRKPWMDDVLDRDTFGEDNEAERGRSTSAKRRSSTRARESMLERKFNELILAIHNMMVAMTTMKKQITAINKFVEGQDDLERHMSPPHPTPDEEEEPREDKMEKEPSLRRLHNLRDRGSTHHGSLGHQEHAFLRSHSHRAP